MSRNLLSVNELSKDDVLSIFKLADKLSKNQQSLDLVSTAPVAGLLFFEASTRTRVGFETAAWKSGTKSIVINETKLNITMSDAESMADTIRTLNPYMDFYCIRHPDAKILSEVVPHTNHPIINCGNGNDEHPTQALIDAYTIWTKFKKLDGLTITMVGQTKYSRAVHSLLLLLGKFSNITINELVPAELVVQVEYRAAFESTSNNYRWLPNASWGSEDVVYSTGFPPKNPDGSFSQTVRDKYKITKAVVKKLSDDCIILNPLPRIDEIDAVVDELPQAYYFKQNELGLYVRMAVIQTFCL
jgi:aspartate carbamoyltransferase catalytic subunit